MKVLLQLIAGQGRADQLTHFARTIPSASTQWRPSSPRQAEPARCKSPLAGLRVEPLTAYLIGFRDLDRIMVWPTQYRVRLRSPRAGGSNSDLADHATVTARALGPGHGGNDFHRSLLVEERARATMHLRIACLTLGSGGARYSPRWPSASSSSTPMRQRYRQTVRVRLADVLRAPPST